MTQQGTLRAIEAELETVRTQLAPGVQAFLASLSSGANLSANYGSGSGARPASASRSPSITPPRSPSSSITLPPPMSSSVAPAPAHARQPSSSSTPTPSNPSSRPLTRPSNPSYNRQQPQQQQPPSPTYPAYPSFPPQQQQPPSPPSNSIPQKQQHAHLSEMLLQALLRLDAILPEAGADWTDVRAARKGAVKEVQGLLDVLDDGWRGGKGPSL